MYSLPSLDTHWRDWAIPLSIEEKTLNQCLSTTQTTHATAAEIPWLIQLVENPKYRLPWGIMFHGAVDLNDHDCIHILLGRGLLAKDEAFTIGYTMGSTHRVGMVEEAAFCWLSGHWYPKPYRFNSEDLRVFRQGLHLGMASNCVPLDEVNYAEYMDSSLGEIRARLGIDVELLKAAYRIEQQLYPEAPECQRLLC